MYLGKTCFSQTKSETGIRGSWAAKKAMHKKVATKTIFHEHAATDKPNADEDDPWNPPYPPFVPPAGNDFSTNMSLSFKVQ